MSKLVVNLGVDENPADHYERLRQAGGVVRSLTAVEMDDDSFYIIGDKMTIDQMDELSGMVVAAVSAVQSHADGEDQKPEQRPDGSAQFRATLAGEWASFESEMIATGNDSRALRQLMHRGFYSGATALYAMMRDGNADAKDVYEELVDFSQAVLAGKD